MPDRCNVLALKNPHPRDSRVEYVDETHSYYLDGRLLPISVSSLWARYFPHFDANGTSSRASRALLPSHPRPTSGCLDKYFDVWAVDPKSKYHTLIKYLSLVGKMSVPEQRDAIKALWSASGTDASDAGTQMHHDIEFYLNGLTVDNPDVPEFQQFLQWRKNFFPDANPEPWRTEFSIFDEEADLAGQIDCLMKTADGRYIMVDWCAGATEYPMKCPISPLPPHRKRCNPTPRRPGMPLDLLGPKQSAFQNETGLGACIDMPNTSFSHYVIQQNLYTYILVRHRRVSPRVHGGVLTVRWLPPQEHHYDIRVDSMWLVQLHPALKEPHCVQVPREDAIVDKIMQSRYEEVRAKRHRSD